MGEYYIGVDVGGTKCAFGLFDRAKRLLARANYASDPSLDGAAFFDRLAAQIIELVPNGDIARLIGVGIGMPSYVDFAGGHIVKTVNLAKIADFYARDYLMTKLNGVPVVIDNDAHAAALAEHRFGAGRGFHHMLYCPVSTGISSGMIIDDKIFRGTYGFSGESGHMIVTPGEGIMCGCGNRGCLMSYCSGAMIVKHVQNWITAGENTILPSSANLRTADINAAYERGDALAIRAVEQMARYMSVWLYNLYVTLNINCFVFGGGLLNMGEKLFGRVREYFDEYNRDDHPVFFKTAELGEDFGIIGAAELIEEQ